MFSVLEMFLYTYPNLCFSITVGVVFGQNIEPPVTARSKCRCTYTAVFETHLLHSGKLHLTNYVISF